MAPKQTPNTNTLEAILRWGIYIVAFVPLIIAANIFSLPEGFFIFKDFLAPFHFGKVILFRVWVEILAVLYIYLVLSDSKFLPRWNALLWSITAFTAVFLLTTLTSVNFDQSFMGTLERMGGWFSFVHYWIFFIIATSVLRSREHWINLLKFTIWVSLLSAIYGFLQKGSRNEVLGLRIFGAPDRLRIFGTIGNAALFAGYMLLTAYASLALAFLTRNKWRFVYGAIFVIDIVAVLMTAVRGSILGVLASLFALAVLYAIVGQSRQLKTILFVVAAVLILAEGFLVTQHNAQWVKDNSYLTRLSDASLSTPTVQTRLWAWRAGIDGWNDNVKTVLLGWGPENFNVPFSIHFNPAFFTGPGSETLFDRAHDMFVETLATMGILGLSAYSSMFVALFVYLIRLIRDKRDANERIVASVLIAGLIAHVVHNVFFFSTSADFIIFFTLAGLVHFMYGKHKNYEDGNSAPLVGATVRYSIALVALVLVGALTWTTAIKPARANHRATEAVVAGRNGDHQQAVALFESALDFNTFGTYEFLNSKNRYGEYIMKNVNAIQESGVDARQLLLSFIAREEELIKNNPLDHLPHLYVSRLYIILGSSDKESEYNDKALEHSMRSLEIAPNFAKTFYEIGQAYINKKDYDRATEAFQNAVDINPEVGLSWWYLGIANIDGGDVDEGLSHVQTALENGYRLKEVDLRRLIDLYVRKGDLAAVVDLLEEAIEKNPGDPQYFATLATTYVQAGNINAALETVRTASQIHPDLMSEWESFAASLGQEL